MRRRSKKQEAGAGFSLFSYLDGLLCTMGALIIVLICISRGARFSHKNSSGEPGDGPTAAELAEELQNTEWRTKHMLAAREKTQQDLQDARLQLSHIEEHSGRLRKQFEELVAAEKALAENADSASDEKLRSEVERLRKAVADAQAEVDEARKRAESRKPSYAIVPYQGPNQTRRRPIYVECTGDRVILQPEGIELTPNDFAGPMGAGNPLAAALRAQREFLYEQNDAKHLQEEPYPLLLIRPDGIDAYCAAREAMQSWQADFGYELIDQDWKLEYQPPNRELAEITQSVVEEARKRQQFLARSMPRRAAQEEWYHAGEHGVVREGGPAGGGPGRGGGRGGRRDPASSFVQRGSRSGGRGGASGLGDGAGRGNGVGNGAAGHGDSGDSTGSGGYGAGGAGRAGGYAKGDGNPDGPNPYAGIAEGIGGGGTGLSGAGTGGPGSGGQGYGGQGQSGVAGQPGNGSGKPGAAGGAGTGAQGPGEMELAKNGATGPGGTKRDGTANSANGGTGDGTGPELGGPNGGPYSGANGQSSGSQLMTAGSGGANSGAQGGGGGSGGAGGGQSAGQQGAAQSAAAGGSSAPGGSGSAGSGGATGGNMPNLQFGAQPPPNGPQPDGAPQNGVSNRTNGSGAAGSTSSSGGSGGGSAQASIASQQGKDWALPEESRHAVPIARPVVVECRADKLVVHAEGATSKVVKEIPMRGATIDSVNELVGTVSEQAATWGPAGRGMYWQPSLSMQVAPGGEARYADLQKLMENSGLDVRPAQAPPKQVVKPKRWFGLVK